ncbi:MAG: adenine phosphoribosyltransferase [Ruminococcus sp.]|nr:adenine phosphoribosyltransferase [Ruminococcus sp.]
MSNVYKMTIAGVERELPLCAVNDKLDIAAFIMFGDVEITQKCAQELLKICPEHDVVVTAEAKSIPLAYEFARIGCNEYVVARKGTKVYMTDPISVNVNSITTSYDQKLFLGQEDVAKLKGKRVLILDDVISTGESLAALEKLVECSGGVIVGKAAVLAEGDAAKRDDIIFLEELPLFFK